MRGRLISYFRFFSLSLVTSAVTKTNFARRHRDDLQFFRLQQITRAGIQLPCFDVEQRVVHQRTLLDSSVSDKLCFHQLRLEVAEINARQRLRNVQFARLSVQPDPVPVRTSRPADVSQQRDGVLPEERIGRGECQAVCPCLTDQHPVEGIAMKRGQPAQLSNGSFIQSQWRDEMFFALLRDEVRGRLRQGQFAPRLCLMEISQNETALKKT